MRPGYVVDHAQIAQFRARVQRCVWRVSALGHDGSGPSWAVLLRRAGAGRGPDGPRHNFVNRFPRFG
jgi:hypothetical protein